MNTQQLMQQYKDKAEADRAARDARLNTIRDQAVARFEDNCRIWFGELIDELELDRPALSWDTNPVGYHITVTFAWQGIDGKIESGHIVNLKNQRHSPEPAITLNVREMPGARAVWSESLDLPSEDLRNPTAVYPPFSQEQPRPDGTAWGDLDYTYQATCQVDALALGKLLSDALEARKNWSEKWAKEADARRNVRIRDLSSWIIGAHDEEALEVNFKTAMAEFPELSPKWENCRQAALRVFEQNEATEQKYVEMQREINMEIERLQKMAAERFRPFVCYKVTYGLAVHGDSELYNDGVIKEICYAANAEPDTDQWWPVLDLGHIRCVRLPGVLSVERIEVNTADQAPYPICAKKYLQSEMEEVDPVPVLWMPEETGVEFLSEETLA